MYRQHIPHMVQERRAELYVFRVRAFWEQLSISCTTSTRVSLESVETRRELDIQRNFFYSFQAGFTQVLSTWKTKF